LAKWAVLNGITTELSSRPKHRGSIAMRSGETRRLSRIHRSDCGLAKWFDWLSPILAEIGPCWILYLDECNFLDSRPSLQLLLALDAVRRHLEVLEVDETVALIGFGETLKDPVLVFADAKSELGCETDVEGKTAARHDVDVEVVLAHFCLGGEAAGLSATHDDKTIMLRSR
jgi:hypothetical protein